MNQPITLEQLLASRDARRGKQLQLLADNPGQTLIVLTVVIPGNVKRTDDSLIIAQAGCDALANVLKGHGHCAMKEDLPTGFEAYFLTDHTSDFAKQLAYEIEDRHPLGRMMDIDVFDTEGNSVSRTAFGRPTRRCLLCGNDARICMRAFTHSQSELLAEIHRRVKLWQKSAGMHIQGSPHQKSGMVAAGANGPIQPNPS